MILPSFAISLSSKLDFYIPYTFSKSESNVFKWR